MDTNAFALQEGAVFLYFDNFYSLMLADNFFIYLPCIIIYGNLLKYIHVAVTSPTFLQRKLCITPL